MTDPIAIAPVVHLVGAGLGDLGSVTRRAARLLAHADVVVVDRRSLDDVVGLAPATAELVHVGRHGGHRAWVTEAIVDLLVDRARAGLRVVRLKGGDPFVCSRGAEEALGLADRGIAVEVTPGVTSATASGMASGIDRGLSVTVVSGNHDPIGPVVGWSTIDAIDPGAGAVVVLTGRSNQGLIAAGLMAGGRGAGTVSALVHGAGRSGEAVTPTVLGELAGVRLPAPAALVVSPCRPGGAHAHS